MHLAQRTSWATETVNEILCGRTVVDAVCLGDGIAELATHDTPDTGRKPGDAVGGKTHANVRRSAHAHAADLIADIFLGSIHTHGISILPRSIHTRHGDERRTEQKSKEKSTQAAVASDRPAVRALVKERNKIRRRGR